MGHDIKAIMSDTVVSICSHSNFPAGDIRKWKGEETIKDGKNNLCSVIYVYV